MSAEQNIATFRQLIEEGFSKGNLEVLHEVFAPNFVEHQDGFVPPNAEGVKGAIVSLRTAALDLKLTLEEIIASGEKTWARITARGPHKGPFMGRPSKFSVISSTLQPTIISASSVLNLRTTWCFQAMIKSNGSECSTMKTSLG